jgi:hypothetical protein
VLFCMSRNAASLMLRGDVVVAIYAVAIGPRRIEAPPGVVRRACLAGCFWLGDDFRARSYHKQRKWRPSGDGGGLRGEIGWQRSVQIYTGVLTWALSSQCPNRAGCPPERAIR